ncbi:MAG: type I restriction enzyme HsdR N-terminal domain-containing protein, partial [Bacteroidales bacterium]|nr:type I restriction enzyme HsdR N-terminal domain-containing protein [Bacteroidales bacterium]
MIDLHNNDFQIENSHKTVNTDKTCKKKRCTFATNILFQKDMQLSEILKDSDYRHVQFDLMLIYEFEQRIIVRTDNKRREIPYINCLIRKKEIRLTPEEAIRQLYLEILLNDYKYPADRIELEYAVTFGREKKRADIVIFDKDNTTAPYIIVEMKKPKLKDGKEQLKSY